MAVHPSTPTIFLSLFLSPRITQTTPAFVVIYVVSNLTYPLHYSITMDATQQDPTSNFNENHQQQANDQLEVALKALEDGVHVRRIKGAKIHELQPLLLHDRKWLKYPMSMNPLKFCKPDKALKKGLCFQIPAFFKHLCCFRDKVNNQYLEFSTFFSSKINQLHSCFR